MAIKIPAIRGKIGTTIYYTTNLTFEQIQQLVKRVDEELHTSKSLKDEIQRSLTDNYKRIKDYILNKPDYFFDSLVLAIYDGDPKWTEIRYEIDDDSYNNVGLLELSGKEKIFPVDGQHRVEGIKAALEEDVEISQETISVILIGHSNTPEGMERSRRIFSTLNRYVKPVRLGDIIALDEDDIVAIVTRDMLETYPLFTGNKIKASNSKSIPTTDKTSFTSLMTLYECHKRLLNVFLLETYNKKYSSKQFEDYLKSRPQDEVIMNFTEFLQNFWDLMIEHFPEIQDFVQSNSDTAAEKFRSISDGGNIFFRPIGLLPFVEAISQIKINTETLSLEMILQKYSTIDRCVSHDPWNKIIWNPINNKMIMRNQSLVKYLLINMFEKKLLSEREREKMILKYATVLNISKEEAFQRISTFAI